MMEEAGLASRKMRLRLIAPPAMQEGQWVDRPELLTESRNLGKEYKRTAKRLGIGFYRCQWMGNPDNLPMEFIYGRRTPYFCRKHSKRIKYLRMIRKKDNGKGRFDHGLSWLW